MDATGRLHLGLDYAPKVARLQALLGSRNDADAVRNAVDSILEDADEMGLDSLPRKALGIKILPKVNARRKQKALAARATSTRTDAPRGEMSVAKDEGD